MADAFFISGDSHLRWVVGSGHIDAGYPEAIARGWTGIDATGFDQGVDASLDLGQGSLYMFRGDGYIRIRNANNAVDAGPNSIGDLWPGMSDAGFADGIHAAVNFGNGTAYFFKGDRYVAYDIAADRVSAGPRLIADRWGGLAEAGFGDSLDAAVNWGIGVIYFFRGDVYAAYNIATNTTSGPLPVADDWPGLADVGFIPPTTAWVTLEAPAPIAAARAGVCIWYFNGQVFEGNELPRTTWFPGSTHATDFLGHGREIFEFVVHSDGTVLRGQPHLRAHPGSYAWLNRNPGNITTSDTDYGQYPGKVNWRDLLIFPTHDVGFAAIGQLLRGPNYGNLTLLQAFQKYAPIADGNDPVQYATDVAAAAGVTTGTVVNDLDDDQLLLMQHKIEEVEGTVPGDTFMFDSEGLPPEVSALITG